MEHDSTYSFPSMSFSKWDYMVFLQGRKRDIHMIAVIIEIHLTRHLLLGEFAVIEFQFITFRAAIVRASKSVRWPKPRSERLQ